MIITDIKVMPQNLDVEKNIIGLILANPRAINDIVGILKPKDFYMTKHVIIYTGMMKMYSNDVNIDIVTLADELKKRDELQKIGGITYLSELAGSALLSNNIVQYAKILKDKSNKREIIRTAQEMLNKAYDEVTEVKEIINKAEDDIYNINAEKENRMVSIVKSVEKTLGAIETIFQSGGGILGASCGFSDIDKLTNGLQKGDFIILAARPSMGKTAMALNISNNVGKNNKVALFSLEMSEEQLTQRMLSTLSGVKLKRLRTGRIDDNEWKDLAKCSSLLATRKIKIDDTAGQTVNEIKSKCRKLKIKDGLDVAIIDYIGLIESASKTQNREQEISKISRDLKRMAKELDITVIALSQLSRAPEIRTNHRPMLSDLRESGSIEQDADIVMFLYRDEYYNADTEDKNIAECIVAKNRNGEVGTVKLAWNGAIQKFISLDRTRREANG